MDVWNNGVLQESKFLVTDMKEAEREMREGVSENRKRGQ